MNENNSNGITRVQRELQNMTCCNWNAICFLIGTIKCLFIDESIFKYFVIRYYEFGENTITVVLNI